MIEPMTKVHFLFLPTHQQACLSDIGRNKLVHLDSGPAQLWQPILEAEGLVKDHGIFTEGLESSYRLEDAHRGEVLFGQLKVRLQQVETLELRIKRLESELTKNEPFERFDPHKFETLARSGWYSTFYKVRDKDLELFGAEVHWFPLVRQNHQWVVWVLSGTENPFKQLVRLRLPRNNTKELSQMIRECEAQIRGLQAEISEIEQQAGFLFAYVASLKSNLQFEQATDLVDNPELGLCSLSGFAPSRFVDRLRAQARASGFVMLEEPADPAQAPTLLRQNRFTRLFNPVMRFIGVTPGVQEVDASGLFLVFFSLFFAMLVGDAGYGLMMILATLGYRLTSKKAAKQPWGLYLLLGFSTLVWGSVTGVWFGIHSAGENRFFGALVVPALDSWSDQSASTVIKLTFVLGWLQLSLAHLWRMLRGPCWSSRGAELGWLLFLAGLFGLASFFVLQEPMATATLPLIAGGLLCVVVFGEQTPQVSPVKGVIRGLANLPLNLLDGIGQFSDLVSYIRLFAVGLATKEMAVTFNQLAMDFGFHTFLHGVAAVLILLVGHWINLALAGIAVMVHAVRLNFLECAKHLGLQWTGREYRPFEYNQIP